MGQELLKLAENAEESPEGKGRYSMQGSGLVNEALRLIHTVQQFGYQPEMPSAKSEEDVEDDGMDEEVNQLIRLCERRGFDAMTATLIGLDCGTKDAALEMMEWLNSKTDEWLEYDRGYVTPETWRHAHELSLKYNTQPGSTFYDYGDKRRPE